MSDVCESCIMGQGCSFLVYIHGPHFPLWVPGMILKSPGLCTKWFYPLSHLICLAFNQCAISGAYSFPLETASNSVRKLLVAPVTLMSPLYKGEFLSRQSSIVAGRVYHWLWLLMVCSLSACLARPVAINASQQAASLQLSSSSGFQCLVSSKCDCLGALFGSHQMGKQCILHVELALLLHALWGEKTYFHQESLSGSVK